MPLESAKGAWHVQAGVVPGEPNPEFSKSFGYTSAEYEEDGRHRNEMGYQPIFMQRLALAQAYATQIMNPAVVNWVELTFIWF